MPNPLKASGCGHSDDKSKHFVAEKGERPLNCYNCYIEEITDLLNELERIRQEHKSGHIRGDEAEKAMSAWRSNYDKLRVDFRNDFLGGAVGDSKVEDCMAPTSDYSNALQS